MTAVPPPVPPEIVERAAAVIAMCVLGSAADLDERQWEFWRNVAETAIAAVYGDIVEAARRDALTEAAEQVARTVEPNPISDTGWSAGVLSAARIVTEMARGGVPRRAGSDQQPESGSTPVRDSEGPQIAAEGFGDD